MTSLGASHADAASPAVPHDAAAIARRFAADGGAWFWLDGEAPAPGEARVSYLGRAREVRTARAGREREFLAELRAGAAVEAGDAVAGGAHGAAASSRSGSGFSRGWVVAFAYEFGVGLLEAGAADAAGDTGPATAFALRIDEVVRVEHGAPADAGSQPAPTAPTAVASGGAWRRSDERYASDVEACRRAISAGDAYVLCLTDTVEARDEAEGYDPLELFLRLRAAGPATRGGLLVTPERALVSLSPERFIGVSGHSVETHPIKGTRPRGATPAADRALAAELADDPKERAENLMIVDLMRNDLSRVCAPGSVAVEGFLRVEAHPHVLQLVSTVTGTLSRGRDVYDVIEAAFPGGSMTGAPKRRAVEILASLEGAPRGLYSGCFGWIDASGDAELAMTIRSIELRADPERAGAPRFTRAFVGAGGGITADSIAAREVAEKHVKASPLRAALAV